MSGSPWASRMRPRTAGWTVVRVSSVAAAAPAYAVRCTTCTWPSRPSSSPKTDTTSAATTSSRGSEVRRRPVCVLTPAVAGSGCGPRRAGAAGPAGRRPSVVSVRVAAAARSKEPSPRIAIQTPPISTTTVAVARPSSAPEQAPRRGAVGEPRGGPGRRIQEGREAEGRPAGRHQVDHPPGRQANQAPCAGPRTTAVEATTRTTRSGRKGVGTPKRGSTVATVRAATRTKPVRSSPSRLRRGITTVPSRPRRRRLLPVRRAGRPLRRRGGLRRRPGARPPWR